MAQKKRNLVFLKGIDNPDMSAVEKILRPLVHLVIEKKYSEEEKREMFKKMSEARKTGKALKLAELLPGKFWIVIYWKKRSRLMARQVLIGYEKK